MKLRTFVLIVAILLLITLLMKDKVKEVVKMKQEAANVVRPSVK